MNDSGLVQVMDGTGYCRYQLGRDTRRQRVAGACRQTSPGDQVDDQIEASLVLICLMDLNDVAMAETSGAAGLVEPVDTLGITDPGTDDDNLDCHAAGESRLQGLIDDPHSATPSSR